MSRPHHRRCRALAAACLFLPAAPTLATTYDLYSKTIDLATAPYTADDTLNCRYVTFTSSLSSATLPAALNLLSRTTINTGANVTLAGPLSGSDSFSIQAGSLTLTAPSPSFTGSISFTKTPLRLTDPTALGPASAPTPISLFSAILDVSGSLPARPVQLVYATLANDTPTPVTVGPDLSIVPHPGSSFTLSGTGDLTFSSPLPSASNFIKSGTGTATYSTPTTFSNGISVNAGTLRLGIDAPFAGSAGPLTVIHGATLDLNGFNSPGYPISYLGGSLVNNNTSSPSTLADFPVGSSGSMSFGGAGTLDLAAPLPTSLSFTKVGPGTLTLSADNTSYTGTITVAAGSLRLGHPAGAGNSSTDFDKSYIHVSPGGEFDLNGFALPRVQVVFDGGALVNNNTSTPVTLAPVTYHFYFYGPITLGGTGEIIATRPLSSVTKTGPGTLTLNRAAGASGAWTVNGGTVRLARSDALSAGSTVTVNPGGALDLNGFPMPTDATVTLNDGALVNNNTSTPVTLTAPPAYDAFSHYPRFGGDGTLNLNSSFFHVPLYGTVHKVGTGLLTLPSSGLYANLSVDAGLVQIESNAQLGDGFSNYTTLDGGGIRVGPLNLAPLSTYSFTSELFIGAGGGTIDTQADTILAGPIRDSTRALLTKTGPANLALTYRGFSDFFLYDIPITVNQGTLSVFNPSYSLSQTPLTLNADNALTGSTSFTLGALAGTGALSDLSITTGALNLSTTYAGAFTNGSLTTTGTGSLTLTGPVAANAVSVNSGTLQIGDGHTTGSVSSPITVDHDAQLTFNRADPVTHTGSFSGSGTLNKLAPNTLTLTRSPGTLGLNVAAGTLRLAPGLTSTPHPFSLSIAPGAALDLTTNSLLVYPRVMDVAQLRQYLHDRQLISSTADSLHTLGYRLNPADNSVTVQPALIGDADLDGVVNADDYALLDRSYARAFSNAHWTDGDFTYDGLVDANDYLLIDTTLFSQTRAFSPAFLSQRESQFGSAYVSQLLTSVPEPALSSILYLLPSLPLTRRRRGKNDGKMGWK